MLEKHAHFIEKTVIGLLAATLATPLIISSSTLFPFIAGKAFLFQILVEAALAGWLLLVLLDPARFKPSRHVILITVGLYLVIAFVSAVKALVPEAAFWSSYERMDGWVMLAHVSAYVLLLSVFLRKPQERLLLLRIFLVTSALAHLYALGQLLELPGIYPPQAGRIEGTFGNATYLATFGIFSFFLSLLLAVWEKNILWRYSAVINALAGASLTILTATRGGILGLFVSLIVAGVLGVVWLGSSQWRRAGAAGIAVLLLLAVGIWLGKDSYLISNFKPLERVTSISLNEGTVKSRLLAWQVGWQAFLERPLLGWGRESYLSVFATHFNPEIFKFENKWLDRPHNKYVEVLVTEGVLGFVSYALVFFAIGISLLRLREKKALAGVLLAGLFTGYAVQNMSLFDHPASSLLFGFSLGLLAALTSQRPSQAKYPVQLSSPIQLAGLAAILAAFFAVLVWSVNVKPFLASKHTINALRFNVQGFGSQIVAEEFQRALAYNTFGQHEIRAELAKLTQESVNKNAPAASLLLAFAIKEAGDEYSKRPLDIKFGVTYVQLLVTASSVANEAQLEAEKVIKQLQLNAPNRPEPYFEEARLEIFKKDYSKAALDLQKAILLNPRNAQYYFVLALVERMLGQPDSAAVSLSQGLTRGLDWRLAGNLPVIDDRQERTFQNGLRKAIQQSSSEVVQTQLKKVLAVNLAKTGQAEQARALANEINNQQVKDFIEAIIAQQSK